MLLKDIEKGQEIYLIDEVHMVLTKCKVNFTRKANKFKYLNVNFPHPKANIRVNQFDEDSTHALLETTEYDVYHVFASLEDLKAHFKDWCEEEEADIKMYAYTEGDLEYMYKGFDKLKKEIAEL